MVENADVKKGYKNSEVGTIPNDWDTKPIAEITSLMTNGFVGTVKSHYTDFDNGILYIQGYNVDENKFNFNGIKRVTHDFHKQHLKSCLQEGDLLTIQTGDIGITTVVPRELEGANCHALIITRFKKRTAEPKFYSYYFNFSVGRRRLKEIETGSTMKHINVGDMKQMLIPYPTLAEQTTIATALNDADALITMLENLIAKKRAIKQGAMQELLRPKEGWKITQIKTFASISTGAKNTQDRIPDGAFPFFVRSPTIEKIDSYSFDGEAILVAGDGVGTGKVMHYINGKFDFHQRVYKISDFKKLIYGYYFYLFFKENFYNRVMQMTAKSSVDSIRMEMISEMNIPHPSYEIQTQIGKVLSDMNIEISALEKKLEKYKMLKQGMMQNLLTGKIRLV
ncbi:MAG: restriction endonuclease subunit S [Saprospiraceae bacterium]